MLYYSILVFVIGTIFGSFYNVVGSRIPVGESIISPGSHCNKCKHKLGPFELIPIISFLIQKGRCRNCGDKLSYFYPLHEFLSGLLFMLAYISYGLCFDLIIALTFISLVLIIIVSDYEYMIISDEVLIFFGILLIIEIFINSNITFTLNSIFHGIIAFIIMFLIKMLGDFMFKRESMGGGDIKLMFIFGLVIGIKNSVLSIFLASLIGLPISLLFLYSKEKKEIPFGPFLGIAAVIIILSKINIDAIINFIS